MTSLWILSSGNIAFTDIYSLTYIIYKMLKYIVCSNFNYSLKYVYIFKQNNKMYIFEILKYKNYTICTLSSTLYLCLPV